jgi:hypothetical protein
MIMLPGRHPSAATAARIASACLLAAFLLSVDAPTVSAQASEGRAPNSLTAAERADGWQLLFDGSTFQGWRGLNLPEVPHGHWVIEDGSIRKVATAAVVPDPSGRPRPRADLVTEGTFEDFELVWEWRISPRGNSGLKYNVDERMSTARSPGHAIGFEYQLIDDHATSSRNPTGALYDLIPPPSPSVSRPTGEWNQSRIVVRGDEVEHWLNGVKLVGFGFGSPQLKAAVANSKFRETERFADKRSGHIVLQDHGDDAWFRSIKIRRLVPSTQ